MQTEIVPTIKDVQNVDIAASVAFRAWIFAGGDWLFLIFTGVAAVRAMHLVHSLGWRLAFVVPVGMVAAMLIQMMLAKAVAPLLGSIESLIPSMLAAMFVPMPVCILGFVGVGVGGWAGQLSLGALGGTVVFFLIKLYEYRYKQLLRRTFPT